jgi:acetyl esterase/lipase
LARRDVHRYGDDPAQVAELFAPAEEERGVAVVIHGGFWRAAYDRHLMDDLCRDLAAAGWAAWNIEYRRLGNGGGWPATFDDVAAALGAMSPDLVPSRGRGGQVSALTAKAPDLVPSRGRPVVTIGHSAGGHLALWAAAQALGVTHAVAQAGVVDLAEAIRLGLSAGAARELLGNDPDGERLRQASPAELLPLGVPQLLVHGARDDIVPASMSEAYAARAHALGDPVETAILPCGHFEHLDPRSEAWRAVREWLDAL